ncbi:heme exporter protein A [Pseudochelatococcus lubricantis]|uniref:Heme exporter protein A n=1 Tax=Pseudochelatococcus lubricantis TaxID=1538102 RepID=A0ABX0UZB1_9HYPH|nr:heme ABC exporter ATP-binding protein CcmA [Pseudochelatococcus lubricantis]NIJ57290.1 heme exporter protein A [Pseudochelatococcus lubricantis]
MRIVVDNLACRRSGRLLFSGLCFTLAAGQALVITGRNGAGKSSLLALLGGALKPAGGTLQLMEAGERTLPEVINAVGHREGLKAMLTAEENLAFARDVLGHPALTPVEALEKLDVAHLARLPVAYLSAGQRRRVALARLFVTSRPVWLLDEPTSALDTPSQALVNGLMREHLANGGLIVAATHLPLALDGALTLRIEPPQEAEDAEVMW